MDQDVNDVMAALGNRTVPELMASMKGSASTHLDNVDLLNLSEWFLNAGAQLKHDQTIQSFSLLSIASTLLVLASRGAR